ncbi:hypothetical protein EDM56_02950 [Brevibacillus fluminis]|uniref:Uncharacterized protein n=1 Tax=Brevibacillus fluminis TaxID=511487 RepID=A0A3M8DV45_9BACL|nr:hypothetical protein [Brevibacillus fluminis]RNB92048.1 hypothetical protein EDM56_02950 [Brevibacillus fluminis]
MDIRALIESLAKEMLQSVHIEEKVKQRVLFIFCDSTAHEAHHDLFITLANQQICYDMLFLDGETSSWLGMSRVECGGAGKVIAMDEYAPAPLELPKEYDAIIIPEIDLDNAARIASGLKGTIKAEIAFAALVLDKPVIVGEDVAGIKRADRRTLQTVELPKSYRELFARHVECMKALGVDFAPQRSLADYAVRKLKTKAHTETAGMEEFATEDADHLFEGKLLTADWINRCTGVAGGTIWVDSGTIIAPLAYDAMKEKGITLQIKDKG